MAQPPSCSPRVRAAEGAEASWLGLGLGLGLGLACQTLTVTVTLALTLTLTLPLTLTLTQTLLHEQGEDAVALHPMPNHPTPDP